MDLMSSIFSSDESDLEDMIILSYLIEKEERAANKRKRILARRKQLQLKRRRLRQRQIPSNDSSSSDDNQTNPKYESVALVGQCERLVDMNCLTKILEKNCHTKNCSLHQLRFAREVDVGNNQKDYKFQCPQCFCTMTIPTKTPSGATPLKLATPSVAKPPTSFSRAAPSKPISPPVLIPFSNFRSGAAPLEFPSVEIPPTDINDFDPLKLPDEITVKTEPTEITIEDETIVKTESDLSLVKTES